MMVLRNTPATKVVMRAWHDRMISIENRCGAKIHEVFEQNPHTAPRFQGLGCSHLQCVWYNGYGTAMRLSSGAQADSNTLYPVEL